MRDHFPSPPRQPQPLRPLLVALLGLVGLAFAGLVLASFLSRPHAAAYANEDYQVPPVTLHPSALPTGRTVAEALEYVNHNRLYAERVPTPVRCTAVPPPLGPVTDAQLQTHFDELVGCFDRVWSTPLAEAGDEVTHPTVTIYGDELTTKCGTIGINAMYCSADQQLYFSDRLTIAAPALAQSRWSGDVIMAHEFGHLVQARAGILTSVYLLRDNASSPAKDLEIARRKEQQADCLSGLFTRTVSLSQGITQADLPGIERVFTELSDDNLGARAASTGTHGSARSRHYWHLIGLGTDSINACNTFIAPAAQVR